MENPENIVETFNTKERSFEDFNKSFEKQSEEVEVEEIPKDEEDETTTEPEVTENDETIIDEVSQALNEFSGEILVEGLNTGVMFGASILANSEKTLDSKYKIDAKHQRLLGKAVENVLPKTKSIMPPWVQLIIILVMAIAPIMFKAYQDRKDKEELKRKDAQLKEAIAEKQRQAEINKQQALELEKMKAKEVKRAEKLEEIKARKKAKKQLQVIE